jgi:tRNA (guanine26-N2/guanine27-N2)-dimethyltransferase
LVRTNIGDVSESVSSSETVSAAASAVINVDEFDVIQEGKAEILAPKGDKVFYNKIQRFNRDLSVMAIKAYIEIRNEAHEKKQLLKQQKSVQPDSNSNSNESPTPVPKRRKTTPGPIRILEALSATGLRAIRYGHEIPQVSRIVANDLLADAVKSIDRSITYNNLQNKIDSNHGDAIKFMSSVPSSNKFHVIDLDPYGSATPFMDSALQAIEDDGILLVTCTDAGVFAGSGYPEKCYAAYNGNNFGNSFINSETNHEAGLRLILNMIATTAAKYGKAIEPLLSLSIDYYARLFIKVKTSPIEVKRLSSKTMVTFACNGCGHKVYQPLGRINGHKFQYPRLDYSVTSQCKYCESAYTVAGPMWFDKIHNEEFVNKVLLINNDSDKTVYQTTERIKGMLTLAKNELEEPFYFNLNQLSSMFKAPPIPIDDFVKAIGNMNYKVSLTHAKKNCIKTDAPWDVVLKVTREWLIKNNKEYIEQNRQPSAKVQAKIDKLKQDIGCNPNLLEGTIGFKVLKNLKLLESIKVDFGTDNEQSETINKLRKLKMVRFQENPEKNWGPQAKQKTNK